MNSFSTKLAVEHVVGRVVHVAREVSQELRLHLAQRVGRGLAAPGQSRVGLLPLAQLGLPLAMVATDLSDQFLEQLVLAVLGVQDLAKQAGLFGPLFQTAGCGAGMGGQRCQVG